MVLPTRWMSIAILVRPLICLDPMGRGKVRHRGFTMAAGEMSAAAFKGFLNRFIRCVISSSGDGSMRLNWPDFGGLP